MFGFGLPNPRNKLNVRPPDLMSSALGALTQTGGFLTWTAGQIYRYSSVNLTSVNITINGSNLGLLTNDGHYPVVIGCKNNFTMSGCFLEGGNNARTQFSGNEDILYTALTTPFDSALQPISYICYGAYGGEGGQNVFGNGGGFDGLIQGHGGGGAGYENGFDTDYGAGWGQSGAGGMPLGETYPGGVAVDPFYSVFGDPGSPGGGGESAGTAFGGGGSGGVRGLSGNALYIQIGGVASVPAGNVFLLEGSPGGPGGDGGPSISDFTAESYGGGGGAGAAGGSGGALIVRYKSGTFTPSVSVNGGTGGAGGNGGIATGGTTNYDGYGGGVGSDGFAGTIDIATY